MIISDCLDTVSVNRAAELLEVSRSGFYKWFQRSISPDSDPNLEIQNIVIEFSGYGYRIVTIELQNRGYSVKEKNSSEIHEGRESPVCEKEVQITDY